MHSKTQVCFVPHLGLQRVRTYLELDLPVLNGNQNVTENMYMSLGLFYF